MPNSWVNVDQALEYLARADRVPHRAEGEGVLARDLERCLPGRILDLGCGDGRLTAILLEAYPESTAICVDMSPPMLDAVSERFAGDDRVIVATHDFEAPLAFDGPFDAIVSSLAIHHCDDQRKRTLYAESRHYSHPAACSPTSRSSRARHSRCTISGATRWVRATTRPTGLPTCSASSRCYGRRASPMSTASGSGAASRCSEARAPKRGASPRHRGAAVGAHHDAGDELCRRRRQVERGERDVVGLAGDRPSATASCRASPRTRASCRGRCVPSGRSAWRSFIGVSIHPGAIALTRTCNDASSIAKVRDSCATATFAVA